MNKTIFKINYEDRNNGFRKFLVGDIIGEDEFLIKIKTKDNKEWRIAKDCILEIKEVERYD